MKRTISILLSALLLVTSSGFALADSAVPMPLYNAIQGVVTSVTIHCAAGNPANNWITIAIEDANGQPATLQVTGATCYPFDASIGVGAAVTGYYLTSGPAPMIYPPQYNIAVLAAGIPDDQTVKVDRFHLGGDAPEGMYLSEDGMLALNIDATTPIVDAQGKAFEGSLDGLKLAVIYDASTRSIPAQTTPVRVIVLPEE